MSTEQLDLSTAQAAWQALLAALETGDSNTIGGVARQDALKSLASATEEWSPERLRQLAANWRQMKLDWQPEKTDENGVESVVGLLGPEEKQHVLTFKRFDDEWRLHQWTPGL